MKKLYYYKDEHGVILNCTSNMLYFVREVNPQLFRYTWDAVDYEHKVIVLPSIKRRFLLKLCHLFWLFHFFPRIKLFDSEVYDTFSKVTSDDHVVFYCNPRIICNIVPFLPKNRSRIWFWDPINRMFAWENMMRCLKSLNVPMATFDKDDAKKYGISYFPTFYAMKKYMIDEECFSNNIDELNELYFCGLVDKSPNRKQILAEIRNVVDSIPTKFVLKVCCGISYEENIQNVKKSLCLVEINQTGQNGLTLRTMEALCFKKKLITTNLCILDYDFYNPSNIFVWGYDNIDRLPEFLQGLYQTIPDSIVMKYDVNKRMEEIVSLS